MKLFPWIFSILTVTSLNISTKVSASDRIVFSCSAIGVLVEVHGLPNGKLRYEAYNIPTTHQRPDLVINGGTVTSNKNKDTLYRFKNGKYLYVAVKPGDNIGYGEVLIYKNNKLITKKPCGDV